MPVEDSGRFMLSPASDLQTLRNSHDTALRELGQFASMRFREPCLDYKLQFSHVGYWNVAQMVLAFLLLDLAGLPWMCCVWPKVRVLWTLVSSELPASHQA